MKSARLLSTAAALLLATGAASAQSMKQDQSPGAAAPPAAQQKAPAEKIAPPMHKGEIKADEKKATQNKTGLKSETTGQAPKSSDMDKKPLEKSESPATHKGATGNKADPNGNAEIKSRSEKGPTAQNGASQKSTESNKTGVSGSSTQSTETNKTGASGTATTGQGPAATAKLSTEQRTRISTVIKQQKVERVEPSKLNISIAVGARVPTTVRFHPLPVEVVTIYPEWRGYDYILVGNEILVINPRTHEIVAILEA